MISKKVFIIITTALTTLIIAVRRHRTETPIYGFTVGAIFLNLVLIWCYHAYIYPHVFSKLRNIPIAPDYHLLGAHSLITSTSTGPFTCYPFRKWVEQANTDLIRYFDLRHVECVIPISHSALQELLTTKCYDFGKPSFLKTGSNLTILGDGLLLAEGEMHRRQRKQLTPAFSYRRVKDLVPLFWCVSMHLIRAVEKQRDIAKGTVTILPNEWASRGTLDIIGQAGLGRNFNAIDSPEDSLAKAYSNLFELDSNFGTLLRLVELVVPYRVLQALPLLPMQKFVGNITAIRKACREMILEKKAMRRKATNTQPVDILSAILSESEVSFSDEQIEEHLLTFLAAGHETTASAMAWALLALCRYPEVQTRLRQELRTHLHVSAWKINSDAPVSAEQLADIPYLQAFCNEVLRLFPPIPATTREAMVDTTLAGHPIPKGTPVVVAIWGTNAKTALWGSDAAQFRPERWLERASGGCKSNYAFQTFLAGPRSCIGMSFAKHEFQCLVAAWVGSFETRFAPGQEEPGPQIMGGISVKPMPGWKIEVEVIEQP